jgi:hypothetical protein
MNAMQQQSFFRHGGGQTKFFSFLAHRGFLDVCILSASLTFAGCSAFHAGSMMPGQMTGLDGRKLGAGVKVVHAVLGSALMTATNYQTHEAFVGKYKWTFHGTGLTPCTFALTGDQGTTLTGHMLLNISPIWSHVRASGEAMDNQTNRYIVEFPVPEEK